LFVIPEGNLRLPLLFWLSFRSAAEDLLPSLLLPLFSSKAARTVSLGFSPDITADHESGFSPWSMLSYEAAWTKNS
jgi:hypothetical protein